MLRFLKKIRTLFLLFSILHCCLKSQSNYEFKIITEAENCDLGSATIEIGGTSASDSISTHWSSGENNFMTIRNLPKGMHSVRIRIKHKRDTIVQLSDTTLCFNIERGFCPISVPKYFTPNDDGINDLLNIGSVNRHPNFEFQVFNKWGQRVHFQKGTYLPWD